MNMISKKNKNRIKKSNVGLHLILIFHTIKYSIINQINNEKFAKKKYKRAGLGDLNLDNPKTFDEKLWWLKYNYFNPLMTECTDKIKVRDYVIDKGYPDILNEVYGIYNTPDEIDWNILPDQFYLKTNHSSATNIYISNKENANKKKIETRLNLFLRKKHYPISREWNYKDIKPKIIAEKVLESSIGLTDYRFLCSLGKVQGLFIDIDTAEVNGDHSTEAKRLVYDKDFQLLDVGVSRPRFSAADFELPLNINEMKEIAEKLSKPFPFSRVDLYNINGKIIFGELTFFHAGGINDIRPREYQYVLGEWIELP